jgi:hypothetical protein
MGSEMHPSETCAHLPPPLRFLAQTINIVHHNFPKAWPSEHVRHTKLTARDSHGHKHCLVRQCFGAAMGTKAKHVHIWVPRHDP